MTESSVNTQRSAPRRGSSGAHIVPLLGRKTVKKFSNISGVAERVGQQGEWIRARQGESWTPHLPDVTEVGSNYYIMGWLDQPQLSSDTRDYLMTQLIGAVHNGCWSRAPIVALDHVAHQKKVRDLSVKWAMTCVHRFEKVFADIEWDRMSRCLTHGDCTLDNLMFSDETLDHVVIDPIPATPAVPDLWCVDVGKMLQSAVNYEFMRYDITPAPKIYDPERLFIEANMPDSEKKAALYWGAVHFLRLLPYMPTEKIYKLRTFGMRFLLEMAAEL